MPHHEPLCSNFVNTVTKFLVSKETVVLRRWESEGFIYIKRVDEVKLPPSKIWKTDVSRVSPCPERQLSKSFTVVIRHLTTQIVNNRLVPLF